MFILIFHSLKILNLQRLNSKYFRPILAFPARTLFLLFREIGIRFFRYFIRLFESKRKDRYDKKM